MVLKMADSANRIKAKGENGGNVGGGLELGSDRMRVQYASTGPARSLGLETGVRDMF